jgi:ELWxxDGT repeat protein
MNRLIAAAAIALASLTAAAQTPYLVKDINTYRTDRPTSSNPYGFFALGTKIFFAASLTTSTSIRSLVVLDGGTLTTLNNGTLSLTPSEQNWAVLNGKLLYSGRDSKGDELWSTDGMPGGTRLLADIYPSFTSSSPGPGIVYHGKYIFAANDGIDGTELWSTDGTPAGTTFFKDLNPGGNSSYPNSFVLFHDTIYFTASGGLWKSDGTPDGTVIVKSLQSASTLVIAGSQLFFNGSTPESGAEPWVSDGTPDGTHMIADINPGQSSSLSSVRFTPFGDRLLFAAYSKSSNAPQVWITDGTATGTHRLGPTTYLSDIAVAGNTAYFSAAAPSPQYGDRVWKTDGTEAGTMVVTDLDPATDNEQPRQFVEMGGKAYFIATAPANIASLWVTDGTAGGTHTVKPNGPIAGFSLSNVGGTLYFSGSNDVNGFELWKSDGTDAGTALVANVATDRVPSSIPDTFTLASDWLYFRAWDGLDPIISGSATRSWWRSDGTPEGTIKLTSQYLVPEAVVGRTAFFNTNGVLWKSEGTPETTGVAKEFISRFPSNPYIDGALGDTLFVSAGGKEWTTKLAPGTPAVSLGVVPNTPLIPFAGRMMFFTDVFPNVSALWSSDGTPEGTSAIKPALGEHFLYGSPTAVMGGRFYFVTSTDNGGVNVTKLWKSDGTFEGTVVVKQLPAAPAQMLAIGNRLFLVVQNKLWVSDGTDTGTQQTALTQTVINPMRVGERLVFTVTPPDGFVQLWVTDGTAEGTK